MTRPSPQFPAEWRRACGPARDKPLQLPEPWSGDIEHAPILFLSSNPSIAHCVCKDGVRCSGEEFPTEAASDGSVIEFFSRRFASGWTSMARTGSVKTLQLDGTYATGGGKYWWWARNRAAQLPARTPRSGIKFALTEVVHCNSTGNAAGGTPACAQTCKDLCLDRVLEIAAAGVLLRVGKQARESILARYPAAVPRDGGRVVGPVTIAGRDRCVVFLPAPSGAEPCKTLKPGEVMRVREICAMAPAGPS